MQEQFGPGRFKSPEILFLSFGGVGFIKKAPGTFGTLAAMPFLYASMKLNIPSFFFIPFLFLLTCASCLVAEYVEKKYDLHDPSWIVIDEVIGVSVAWLFVTEQTVFSLVAIFVLFRLFDILKFGPVAYFDKLQHGAGTILDDVAAGLMAGATFYCGHFLFQLFS
jgi:phosphatidylglycerophosphatase A